ncbi:uncharacterized protein LOC105392298 [Plutella xylostella]|uniref:uncharacterized protein LOC105392298 n=1 Tax=Plutella xylostella TaxID=51655 RepID=UPI00203259D3|nr:uncharacterized protein LOC105392298 [Plutella xylostella]
MANSQFSLSWDSYQSNICNGFSSLQQNGEFVDMTLAADGHIVKVHQMLIALASPYLKELITSAPCQHPVIFLNDVTYPTLCSILEYIYTGEVVVQAEQFQAFIKTAKALYIRGLENVSSSKANSDYYSSKITVSQGDNRHLSISTEQGTEQVSLPPLARKVHLKKSGPTTLTTALINKEESFDYPDTMDDTRMDSDDDARPDFGTSETPDQDNKHPVSSLQFTVSTRGSLQVILNRYLYNLHSTSHRASVRRWRCVDYRNVRCPAYIVTKGNIVINRSNLHTHPFHDKKILNKIERKIIYSAIDEVAGVKEDKNAKNDSNATEDAADESMPIIQDEYTRYFRIRHCRFCSQETRVVSIADTKLTNMANIIMLMCFVILLATLEHTLAGAIDTTKPYSENPTVQKFQEYLQIDTSRPENIEQAVEFWRREAEALGLPFAVYSPGGRPVVVITYEGANSSLPSIMLNSHMDVVEAVPEDWIYPPFSAYMDDEGKIYGRGAQDDKDISIEYIEAIRTLKENNITLQRTIHMTLMPDEETGGFDGMVPFARSEDFKRLNVGFALDEGLPTTDDTLIVTNVDKRPWQMEFTIRGVAGHGSSMQGMDTAAVKLRRLLDVIMEFREDQMKISDSLEKDDGSFTSVNVNIVQGGIATNIVPSEFRLVVDMRLAITAKASDMDEMISSWIMATGANTTVKFIRKVEESPATAVDDSNPYWLALQEAACEM